MVKFRQGFYNYWIRFSIMGQHGVLLYDKSKIELSLSPLGHIWPSSQLDRLLYLLKYSVTSTTKKKYSATRNKIAQKLIEATTKLLEAILR